MVPYPWQHPGPITLARDSKSGKTVRMYAEAVRWFAAAHLLRETGRSCWEEVDRQDVQRWMVWLLERYSDAYASNQYRALQQFFRWRAEEEELPDPMARLRPPKVTAKLVPMLASGELAKLERACQGRTFAQRRDHAIICVFRATGIRLSELAGIRYDPDSQLRSDIDLWQREITVCGKGGQERIVRIGHEAARSLGRYLRVRSGHAQAYRAELWLGANNRAPMTASGIYHMVVRRGRQCGVPVHPIGSVTISATPGWTGAVQRVT